MSYKPFIFPELHMASWAEVDLGALARAEFPDTTSKNLLLDPDFCDQWVKRIALEHGADMTWGGHFEDRQHLWRGYYQHAQKVTHLGVDYNVPSGTLVVSPREAQVVHSWADTSTENGWGGRLILKLNEPWQGAPYLVLGHLAHKSLPVVGEIFKAGDILAQTGVPVENGGWFPHLHVQCVNEDFFAAHKDNLSLLDGYYLTQGKPYDLAPDPALLVGQVLGNS